MGLVDWGDRLDDRLLGRFGRPPETLESGDTEVEEWWTGLPINERRNFVIDATRGTVFDGRVLAVARLAVCRRQLLWQRRTAIALTFVTAMVLAIVPTIGKTAVPLGPVLVGPFVGLTLAWWAGVLIWRRRVSAARRDVKREP